MACQIEEEKRRANLDAMVRIARGCAQIQRRDWCVYKCRHGSYSYGHCAKDSFNDDLGYVVKVVEFHEDSAADV